MPYRLHPFRDVPLDEPTLRAIIENHERRSRPRLDRLWLYFRNPLADPDVAGRTSAPAAQAVGLPSRLRLNVGENGISREVVIENDIAWRIHTLVDFMFPKPPAIVSTATDPAVRDLVDDVLRAVFEANGGASLWHNAALLGSVYGSIDFLLHVQPVRGAARSPIERAARMIRIDTVEAPRGVPVLAPNDYRAIDAYLVHYARAARPSERGGGARFGDDVRGPTASPAEVRSVTVTAIYSATHAQMYEDETLIAEHRHLLGRIPVVHVQNVNQPLAYAGLSDVEPLIPLQDELNTRLSDRANRVTMQCFRMWLGKGIEQFVDRPVGPGQMWMSDNPDAAIESFGGDTHCPSEAEHIAEIREAMDKSSGVTPAAAGHIQSRVGNLTSENAIRISLLGTIAKTNRKRVTYEHGIRELCELVLHSLDVHGVVKTSPMERGVDVIWADAILPDESRRIQDALRKAELGVPAHILRAELGYPDREDDETLRRSVDL
jgi:hypothetical protein